MTNYLTDGVLDLSLGMDAGDLPQLLQPGEAAYIFNGDIGKGFLANRPPQNNVAISGASQGVIHASTSGYFYGCCTYTSDAGVTSIMADIDGELFQFTPQYDASGNALNAVMVTNQTGDTGGQDTSNLGQQVGGVPNAPGQHWLRQAERWVIWNDGVNLPIFWDGSATPPAARRSIGANAPYGGSGELPIGKMLAYGQDQVWMALDDGYSFMMSDPVGWSSGTPAYQFRDAVLKTSINSALFGGGNFKVPSSSGTISGLTFTALLDATLGTGPLQVFAQQAVYGCTAPYTPVSVNNPVTPLLTASLEGAGGACPQNAPVNGDIFFRSSDGQIRSLYMARRDFNQWGNTPVSYEVSPSIQGDSQALLAFGASVKFDNNVLTLVNPIIGPLGVYFRNMVCLSLERVSGIQEKKAPAYNGIWSIGNVLGIVTGTFNNTQRCFAFTYNVNSNRIELHELLPAASTQALDSNSVPITTQFISRALFWRETAGVQEFVTGKSAAQKSEFTLVKLEGGEVAAQNIMQGKVTFLVEFKSVYDDNWHTWYQWTVDNTSGTKGYQPRMGLGKPPDYPNEATQRYAHVDYAFQVRVTITGACQFMGIRMYGSVQPQPELAQPYVSS